MLLLSGWREALGALSVAMALLACGIYVWQTLVGQIRPHPLSWFLFGVLSVTGYWVQRDQGAQAGSWGLLAMTFICFAPGGANIAKGERHFFMARMGVPGRGLSGVLDVSLHQRA